MCLLFSSYTCGLGALFAERRQRERFLVFAAFTFVLAFAQIGVHLVFFLHLGSGSDNTNNILALAFGLLIAFLVITGSIWIIADLSANMMP
jgi:cytochrome o ubiquinol oxidase subunit IV